MKLPLQNIDKYDSIVSEEGWDSFLNLRHEVAKECGVGLTDVYIYNHDVVGEWVINVKGKFYNYVEDYYLGDLDYE